MLLSDREHKVPHFMVLRRTQSPRTLRLRNAIALGMHVTSRSAAGKGSGMALSDLAQLIETSDDTGRPDLPPRSAIEELVRESRTDQLLLLVAAQDLNRIYYRVMTWHDTGRHGPAPLSQEELCRLQERANGAAVCEFVPISGHLAETYRTFLMWYCRMLERT